MAEDGEMRFCSNCKRDIAAKTFELHEVHCRRHIMLCQVCGDPVPVKEQEKHFQEYHALEACDVCGEQVERDKLEEHKDQLCPERRVECKYCELDIKNRDFEQHVDSCGSRTDFCDRCMQRVMLKDMEEHKSLKCGRAHSSDEEVDPTLENIYPDTHGHGHFDVGLPVGARDLLFGSIHYDEYDDQPLEEPVNDFQSNGLPGLEREFEPHDTSGGGHSSVLVDQSWLDTVAEACGPDFDHVLAQNMYYENMRQVSARDEYHGVENGVLQEGVAANRQREEQSQRRQNDADLARQLQSQFDNRVMEEQRDAELAQQLQQETPPPLYQAPPPPYQAPATYPADSVDEDARLAQQLQEEEQRHQMNEGGDARLARRLQEEEQRHKMNEGGGVPGPDNEMVHQRVPDNELYGDGFNPPGSYSIPQDSYPDPSSSYPNPYDPHSSTPGFYPTAYRDDEQPRPKTPPPAAKKVGSKRKTHTNSENPYEESEESEGKIPCQFCHKLFPFAVIMHHQQRCTADYPCSRCGRVHSVHPAPSTSSDYHYGNERTDYGNERTVDVAALLKKCSDSEEESSGTSIACRYCGHSYPSTCVMPHEALCEGNPDKHLKDAYRPPRVNPPRPPMGGAGGGVTRSPPPSTYEAEIPCEFCGKKLKSSMIHAHQPVCWKNPSYKVQRSEGFVRTEEGQRSVAAGSAAEVDLAGVERGPCEFCGQLLPLMELVGHQATCQFHRSTGPLSTSSTHYTPTSSTHYTPTSSTHYTPTSPTHHTVSSPSYYSPSHHTASSPLYHTAAGSVRTATNFAYPTAVPAARQNEPHPAVLKPAAPPSQPPKTTVTLSSPVSYSSLPRSTARSGVATTSLVGSSLYPHPEHRAGQAATSLYPHPEHRAGQAATSLYPHPEHRAGQAATSLYPHPEHRAGQAATSLYPHPEHRAGQEATSLYPHPEHRAGQAATSLYPHPEHRAGQAATSLYPHPEHRAGQAATSLYPHPEHRAGQAATSLTYSCQTTSSPRVVDISTRKRLSPSSSDSSPANSGSKVPRLSSDGDYNAPTGSQPWSSVSYRKPTADFQSPTSTEPPLRSSHFSSSGQHYTPITVPSLTRTSTTLPSLSPSASTPLTLPPSASTPLTLLPSAWPHSTLATLPPPANPSLSFPRSDSSPPTSPAASSTTRSFVPSGRHQTASSSSHLSEADLSPILNRPRPALGSFSTMGLTKGSHSSTPSPTVASETYPSIPTTPLSPLAFSAPGTRGLAQPSSATNQLDSKADQYSKDGIKTKKGSEKELSSIISITHNPSIASGSLTQTAPKTSEVDHLSSYTTVSSYSSGLVELSPAVPPLQTSATAQDHGRAHTADASHDPAGSVVVSEVLQGEWSAPALQRRREPVPATEGLESQFADLTVSSRHPRTTVPSRAQPAVVGGMSSKKPESHGAKQPAEPKPHSSQKSHSNSKVQHSRLPIPTSNYKAARQLSASSSVQTSVEASKPKPKPKSRTSKTSPNPTATATKPSTNNRSASRGLTPNRVSTMTTAVVSGKSIAAQPRTTTAASHKGNTSSRTFTPPSKGRTGAQPSRSPASSGSSSRGTASSRQQTATHQSHKKKYN